MSKIAFISFLALDIVELTLDGAHDGEMQYATRIMIRCHGYVQ